MKRLFVLGLLVVSLATQSIAQSSDKWAELRDAVHPYRESLLSASVLYNKDKWYAQSYLIPTTSEEVTKFLADLSAVEKLMTGDFAGTMPASAYRDNDIMEHPESWLEIARARNDIIKKIKGEAASDKAAFEVKFLNDIAEKVLANDGWGLTENGLKILLGKREEVRKKLCGGENYEGWDAACDRIIQAAKSMAPKARSYANHSDSSINTLIRNGWAKNYKDRNIIKVATAKSDWTVVKDSLGRPKYRSKGVAVQYKVAGFSYVIEQTVSILQDHVGGGQYKYRPTAQVPDYRILSPK